MPNYLPSTRDRIDMNEYDMSPAYLPKSPKYRKDVLKAQLRELRREQKELEKASKLPTPEWKKDERVPFGLMVEVAGVIALIGCLVWGVLTLLGV